MFEKYICTKKTKSQDLLLLILTCLFSASKFEEIYFYPPSLFVRNSQCNSITSESLLKKEGEILAALDFRLIHVCPIDILRRIVFISGANQKIGNISFNQIKIFEFFLFKILAFIIYYCRKNISKFANQFKKSKIKKIESVV